MKNTSKILAFAAILPLLLPTGAVFAEQNEAGKGLDVRGKLEAKMNVKIDKLHDQFEKKMNQIKERTLSGKVTSISGTTIMLTGSKDSVAYTIDASKAKLVRKFGGAMVLGDIQVNDTLFVNGTASTTVITAKLIRDESLQERNSGFQGTVSTITGTSFTLQTKERGLQTINTSASTTIKKNGVVAAFADITVGASVRVEGVWNSTNNNVAAKTVNVIAKLHPVSITGTVTAKTDTTITLTNTKGTVYTVSTSKLSVFGKEWTTLTLGDVAIGDKVGVYGIQLNDTTTITGIWLRDSVR